VKFTNGHLRFESPNEQQQDQPVVAAAVQDSGHGWEPVTLSNEVIAATLPAANGGTTGSHYTVGEIFYGSSKQVQAYHEQRDQQRDTK
jgi:hypothetical protein